MMAEISHPQPRNFYGDSEFKCVGAFRRQNEVAEALKIRVLRSRQQPDLEERGSSMKYLSAKYLKYLALLAVLAMPLAYSQAQVRFGVGIGVGPGYVSGPPVCEYGYYSDYPYSCAPYGYYGPRWFSRGVFIGAGPWYRGWGRPYYGRGFYGRGFYGHDRFEGRGFDGRRDFDRRRGFEGRGSDRGGFVGRGSEGRGFGGRGSEGHGSEGHGHGGGRR
jgi:hypothetical protein